MTTVSAGTRAAGVPLVVFGLAIVAGWVAAALIFGTLMIDVAALAVIGLGVAVAQGSARATPWARALMGAYALASVFVAAAIAAGAAEVLPWRLPLPSAMGTDTAYSCLAVVFAWSLVNLWLLRRR